MSRRSLAMAAALAFGLSFPVTGEAAPVLFQATGSDAAAIQAAVDAFRAALGNPNNANAPGPAT